MDRALRGVHRWVWRDRVRRGRKLLAFAATEADGGRDLARAAENTDDARLRNLFLRHALDEQRHARLFSVRGRELLAAGEGDGAGGATFAWLTPGERGLDALAIRRGGDAPLLAFLHLSEKAAAGRFAVYRDVLGDIDAATRDVFARVLRDEVFHMSYTRSQLVRLAPERHRLRLYRARASRLWKAYLRLAAGLAGILGTIIMTLQYFIVLPLFALLARLSARRERTGWHARARRRDDGRSQYG